MRVNTSWAFAGSAAYAGSQWAVLVLLVKALSPAEVGSYAYALAVTSPIFVLASVRLRHLLATAVASPDDFRDYLVARLLTTGCALLASLAIGVFSTSSAETLIVIALVALARSGDAVSDICHGLFQRELDMRTAAVGLMINAACSVLLVRGALVLWQSLPLAAVGYAAGSCIALVSWDLPCAVRILNARREGSRASWTWTGVRSLLVRALPLGLSSAVGSIQTNLPRYAIASLLGPAQLAVFAAISHIPLLGHLAVNAASQAALPLLAKDAQPLRASYQARLYGLVASTIALGSAGFALTIVVGRGMLGGIYGPAYAEHASVLFWLMAAAVITFTSVILGTGTTARGRFGAQLAISTTSLAVVAASLGPLVQRFGLKGAAGSLLLGSIVELAAYTVLTVRDVTREQPTPNLVPHALAGSVPR
jgi:O-antigen/teichoic acid export membrane protein